jgi:hypothetical protein
LGLSFRAGKDRYFLEGTGAIHQLHVNLQFCCMLLDDVHAVHSG